MSKKQLLDPTELLRKSIKQSGIPLTVIARRAKISIPRFRRIVRYGQEPNLNEAIAIIEAMKTVPEEGLTKILSATS